MINILHIENGWPPGGITEQVYLLAKYLPKDQFKQYTIGYCHFDSSFVKKFEDAECPVLRSDENYSNLKEIIEKYDIDIVHKQTGGGDCPEYVKLLKDMNLPLVESVHCPRASGIPVEYLKKIIYTTEYTYYKNSPEHMSIMESIPYALNLEEPIEKKVKKNKDKLIVGRLGRIVQDKRQDVIFELARMCYEEFGDKIQFHLAGQIPQDFPAHIEYGQAFIKTVESLPNVKYFGYVDNKYDFWQTLDICINPVWEASFDIVFLEAMACGIPILTWDNSAAKYVVGNAGLVKEENIYDIYEGLKQLIEDEKLRDLLGSIGQKYIETKYSLNNFIDKHINLYRGIVK